jgi:hypothetical protein
MKRWQSLLTIYLLIVVMLLLSWRRWCEPIVDFGRELYVPWQLSAGKMLYRDIAYFNGPFSPYFNSIVFRMFGDSLMTLAIANGLLLAAMLTLLRAIIAKIADAAIATIICLCLIPLVCIAQPGPVGNYNFITPYSHEMTHGLLLSFIAIWSLLRVKPWWDIVAGLFAGLTILTKPEIAIACCGAILGGASLIRNPLAVARIAGAMLAPPILAMLVFKSDAFIAYAHLFDANLTLLPFYRMTMGTWDAAMSIRLIVLWGLAGMGLLVLGESVAGSLDRTKRLILLAGLIILVILTRDMLNWRQAAMPLIFVNAWALIHTYRSKEPSRFMFALFAMLLLAKIMLNVTLSNYGFALALPAVCVSVCFFGAWKERLLLREGCGLRCATIAMLMLGTGVIASYSIQQWRAKTQPMGEGADRIYMSPARQEAIGLLDVMHTLPGNATVAVIPQGVMLNYLARRENSTGFIVIMPPEVLMFGEQKMTGAFTKNPPEFVLTAPTSLSEYGYRSFTGYAPGLAALIDATYEEKSRGQGWVLMARRKF